MLNKTNAQFAIEFIILIAFMFLIFLGFTAIITSKISEAKENERQQIAEDIATLAKNELDLAKSVSDGYTRTFVLPINVEGNRYNISIIDNRELVVTYLDKEYVLFLQENIVGEIYPGINTVRKVGGIVFVENGTGPPPSVCLDGIDNDGDTLTDFPLDPGCTDANDVSELGTTQCDDGIDNDLDSFTDFPNDPDCTDGLDDIEAQPECSDGSDNDGDGFTDFPADPDCIDSSDDSEFPPPTAEFIGNPTIGYEPLLVDFTDLSTDLPTSWSWHFGDGGTSTFKNPSYTYPNAGTYTVTLTATNAQGSDDEIKTNYITVDPALILSVRVSADDDDAEECVPPDGSMDLGSSDLELIEESCIQEVGMRFNNINIIPGSTIINATIQFTADESQSVGTSLVLYGENVDDAAQFTESDFDITSRPKTTASVAWNNIPSWNAPDAGSDQKTPDLSSIIQEIINRTGWSSGNSIVIVVTGSGHRTAESHDGSSSRAALLELEYVP